MFLGKQSNEDSGDVLRSSGKKPEVENSSGQSLNFDYVYLNLYTRFQRNANGYLPTLNKDSGQVLQSNRKKAEQENVRWLPLNFNYVYLNLRTR